MKSTGQDRENAGGTARPGGKSPLRTARSLAGRLLAGVARLLVLICAAGVAAKLVGEVVSDRYWWSQWLEWTPNVLVCSGALVLLVPATVLARGASRLLRPARRGRGTAWAMGSAWALFLAHGAYTVVVDAPYYRSRPRAPASLDESVRVLFWNAGAAEKRGWEELAAGVEPDLAIFVGLTAREPVSRVIDRMPEGTQRLAFDRFTVVSALTMKRFAFVDLKIAPGAGYDPRLPQGRVARHDPGAAMYLETAAARDGEGALVTWIIDLPSDISLAREAITREARAVIESFDGQRFVRDGDGSWTTEPRGDGPKGFPTPDLIIGDFNIPRGAASLSNLRLGYEGAFEQAATGYAASWPRRFPLWHLDQAFIGPRFRAWRYGLRDAGSGAHLMQVVDMTGR